jgi:hypothetical protein
MASLRTLGIAIPGFIGLACYDTPPTTAPMIVRAKPTSNMQALPPFSTTLPVTGPNQAVPTYAFIEGVKVEIKIEGEVQVGSDERAPYVNAPFLSLDAKGIWVGGVYNRCYVSAHVSYPSSPGPRTDFGPGNGCTYPRTMQVYIDTGLVRGDGTAIRDAKIPETSVPCDTIVCHTYDGYQTVTIRPLEADLDFEATYNGIRSQQIFLPRFVNDSSGATLVGYKTVIFTDSTFIRGMPRRNLSHTWSFADPTDPGDPYWHKTENTCYAGLVYCEVNIKETGNMVSLTRVNGIEQTDTVTIYCIDSIGVFNSDKVRQGLIAVMIRPVPASIR